jgi:hypothetical protein
MPKLRDGSVSKDPTCTWMSWLDPRSLEWGVRQVLGPRDKLISKTWKNNYHLDQGREGACTGFGATHELGSQPLRIPDLTNEFARGVYHDAQRIDHFPGGSYPGADPYMEGSTVLHAMKVLKKRGYYEQYRWAFGVRDVALAIGYLGPVVIGIPWYEGMREPASCGCLHPIGEKVGGHCVELRGFDNRRKRFKVHNSWGKNWGVNGCAWIKWDDLAFCLKWGGEACIPMKRLNPAAS